MTERLADVSARIAGVRQLDVIVNAMTGIAAARARQARDQIGAVDSYAATIAAAIGQCAGMLGAGVPEAPRGAPRSGVIVFCAEQGFAGAFSERVLDSLADAPPAARLFLIGSRGQSIAAGRGITPDWQGAMPSHSPGIPKFADRIAEAVTARLASGQIDRLDAVFSTWDRGIVTVVRRALLPIDFGAVPVAAKTAPLTNLPAARLLDALSADYLHALICNAALHAFAAENEARMAAMAAARRQIEKELGQLHATERQVRQEAITSEIIELATGEQASASHR